MKRRADLVYAHLILSILWVERVGVVLSWFMDGEKEDIDGRERRDGCVYVGSRGEVGNVLLNEAWNGDRGKVGDPGDRGLDDISSYCGVSVPLHW